jgi:hypothetical protein
VRVDDDLEPPYSRRYVHQAVGQVDAASVTVIAHSGAGPLVPAVVAALSHRSIEVERAVLLDAGMPGPGRSRLDLLRTESPELAAEFDALLAAGGAYPDWTAEQLAELVPDPRTVLAAVRARREDFWREPLPPVELPPDLQCAYVQLSAAYETSAATAHNLGWPVARAELGHLAMLGRAEEVAALIRQVC